MREIEPPLIETDELAGLVREAKAAPESILDYVAPDICIDGPERFEILSELLDDVGYWRWLASLWIYHDTVHDHLATWRRLFLSDRPRREELMAAHERELLARLPSSVEVFRGFNHRGAEQGIAWTPQRDFAEAFAHRWSINPTGPEGLFVARAVVPRDLIVACFDREAGEGTEVVIPAPVSGIRGEHVGSELDRAAGGERAQRPDR
jgi:hypothetical protein